VKHNVSALFSLLLAVFFCAGQLRAQSPECQSNDFQLSVGLPSADQIRGVFGNEPADGFRSTPSSFSSACFLTWRHYFASYVALGLTVGLDNQGGDLSYGRIDHGVFHIDGTTGHYKREAYTVAAELTFTYSRRGEIETYGYLGMGTTSLHVSYSFFPGIQHPEFFYGPDGMVPSNPYTANLSHGNWQITPIGFRSKGNFLVFFEMGYGYKGCLVFGLGYKVVSKKPFPARDVEAEDDDEQN
jgi:hypothetical protein